MTRFPDNNLSVNQFWRALSPADGLRQRAAIALTGMYVLEGLGFWIDSDHQGRSKEAATPNSKSKILSQRGHSTASRQCQIRRGFCLD